MWDGEASASWSLNATAIYHITLRCSIRFDTNQNSHCIEMIGDVGREVRIERLDIAQLQAVRVTCEPAVPCLPCPNQPARIIVAELERQLRRSDHLGCDVICYVTIEMLLS